MSDDDKKLWLLANLFRAQAIVNSKLITSAQCQQAVHEAIDDAIKFIDAKPK